MQTHPILSLPPVPTDEPAHVSTNRRPWGTIHTTHPVQLGRPQATSSESEEPSDVGAAVLHANNMVKMPSEQGWIEKQSLHSKNPELPEPCIVADMELQSVGDASQRSKTREMVMSSRDSEANLDAQIAARESVASKYSSLATRIEASWSTERSGLEPRDNCGNPVLHRQETSTADAGADARTRTLALMRTCAADAGADAHANNMVVSDQSLHSKGLEQCIAAEMEPQAEGEVLQRLKTSETALSSREFEAQLDAQVAARESVASKRSSLATRITSEPPSSSDSSDGSDSEPLGNNRGRQHPFLRRQEARTSDALDNALKEGFKKAALKVHSNTGQLLSRAMTKALGIKSSDFDDADFLGRCLMRNRYCLFVVMVIANLMFAAYFFWKIANKTPYLELEHEVTEWKGGEMELPLIAVHGMSAAHQLKFAQATIQDGKWRSKESISLPLKVCDVRTRKHTMVRNATCVPSGAKVLGTYGDPVYKYAKLDINIPRHAHLKSDFISVMVTSRVTKDFTKIESKLHTFDRHHRLVVEMFFKKVNAIVGDSLGIVSPRDETRHIVGQDEYLVYDSEYKRLQVPIPKDDGYLNVLSFYFRATLAEQRDHYAPFTIVEYLQSAGSLGTSLAMVLSLQLLLCFWIVRKRREAAGWGSAAMAQKNKRQGVRIVHHRQQLPS